MSSSVPRIFPSQAIDGSSNGRKSGFSGIRQPRYFDDQIFESRKCTFNAVGMSHQTREDRMYGEPEKSMWNYLKNKLKPKKKEKHTFISYVETNGTHNFDEYRFVNNHLLYAKPRQSHFMDYNFLYGPKPLQKETRFKASTLDSRKIILKDMSGHISWRAKRQDRHLSAERIYQSRLTYLGEGTLDRIDRWLTESAPFMNKDYYEPTVATAVVGSNRAISQQVVSTPTSKKRRDRKVVELSQDNEVAGPPFIDPPKQKYINSREAALEQTISNNLFRHSSKSVNHLPVSRKAADTHQEATAVRPNSIYVEKETVFDQVSYSQAQKSAKAIDLLNVQDVNILKEPVENINPVQPPLVHDRISRCAIRSESQGNDIDAQKSTETLYSLTVRESDISKDLVEDVTTAQQTPVAFGPENSVGDDDGGGRYSQENSSARVQLAESKKSKSEDSMQIRKNPDRQAQSETSSLPREAYSAGSSMSLDNISFVESYCTDYTPYAFGDKVKLTHLSNQELPIKDLVTLHNGEHIEPKATHRRSQISSHAAEDMLSQKCHFPKDNEKPHQNPREAKFVTTIYLTNDELSLDDFQTNDKERVFGQTENKFSKKVNGSLLPNNDAIFANDATDRFGRPFALRTDMPKKFVGNVCHLNIPALEARHEMQAKKKSEISTTMVPEVQLAKNFEYMRNFSEDYSEHGKIALMNLYSQKNQIKHENHCLKEGKVSGDTINDPLKRPRRLRSTYKKIHEPMVSTININLPEEEDNDSLKIEVNECNKRPHAVDDKAKFDKTKTTIAINETTKDKNLSSDCKEQKQANTGVQASGAAPKNESTSCVSTDVSVIPRAGTSSKAERHSPPLNNFTSKSNFDLFEELVHSPPKKVSCLKTSSPTRSSPHAELSLVDEKSTKTTAQNRQSTESNIFPEKVDFFSSRTERRDGSEFPEEPFFDARAFLSVKHNDHAKIFDLCFGNSSILDKENRSTEIAPDWTIASDAYGDKSKRSLCGSTLMHADGVDHGTNLRSFQHTRAFYA